LAERNVASAAAKTGLWNVVSYRLYGLDGVDKVASAVWIEADDDETAIEMAQEKMDGRSLELWQGKRFVARIGLRQDD